MPRKPVAPVISIPNLEVRPEKDRRATSKLALILRGRRLLFLTSGESWSRQRNKKDGDEDEVNILHGLGLNTIAD